MLGHVIRLRVDPPQCAVAWCRGPNAIGTRPRRSTTRATRSSSPSTLQRMPFSLRLPASEHSRSTPGTTECLFRYGWASTQERQTSRSIGTSGCRFIAPQGSVQVGHGGQILVSQTTVSHLEDDEEDLPGIALKDLGAHRLKDISRPVRLYQLDIDGLRTRFPPLSISEPPKPNRRKRIGLAAAALLIAGAIATTLALASRDQPPPKVLPNSLVRIDPNTLKPTRRSCRSATNPTSSLPRVAISGSRTTFPGISTLNLCPPQRG